MSIEKKEDRRVKYTKKAIRDSFFALLEEKPLEKISVTEICRDADINRGTFYAHYNDPYDLKRKIVEELNTQTHKRIETLAPDEFNTEDALIFLKENQDLCRVFTGENGDFNSLIKLVWNNTSDYLDEYEADIFAGMDDLRAACLKIMIVSSITAIVKVWIDRGMVYAPETIAEMLRIYISEGVQGFKNKTFD